MLNLPLPGMPTEISPCPGGATGDDANVDGPTPGLFVRFVFVVKDVEKVKSAVFIAIVFIAAFRSIKGETVPVGVVCRAVVLTGKGRLAAFLLEMPDFAGDDDPHAARTTAQDSAAMPRTERFHSDCLDPHVVMVYRIACFLLTRFTPALLLREALLQACDIPRRLLFAVDSNGT
ncbi:MAG: hypothetical protein M0008_13910 [Actinomycetota bacterium]|nr:hypothetical protein [Actinomycetota bacterium]